MEVIQRQHHIVDAQDQILGDLAVNVARLLRGKHKPGFMAYKDMGDFVVVKNVNKLKVTGKKLEQKIYYRHSLWLGGLKQATLEELAEKKGYSEVLRKAVMGMLAKNKLRARQIKRLKFEK